MKKLIIAILLVLSLFISETHIFISASSTKYARAVENNINLYKLSTEESSIENILCLVEKTYFVEIISDNVTDYKVNYNGVFGYVKKDDVVPVTNIPTTPYPTDIQITIGSNCNLRSTPTTKSNTSNVITTLYSGESNITFIGRVFSEEAIDFGGTTWYYVSYNGEKGYIYNKYIKSITPIYSNQEETYQYVENNFTTTNPINEPSSIIIMILLFLPCICILFILYYPRKKGTSSVPRKKSKSIDRY